MTNQPLPPSIHTISITQDNERAERDGQFYGWRLPIARIAWFTIVAISILYFVSGMPTTYRIANNLSESSRQHLHALGLAENFSAVYILMLDSLTFVLFAGVAMLLFKERSSSRMALITSVMLIFTAMLYTAPGYEARAPLQVIALGAALAELSQIIFLLTFPTGHFFPRWSRWMLPPLLVWRYLMWAQVYLPHLYQFERTGEKYPLLQQNSSDIALLILFYLFGIATQVYRYRRLSSAEQRVQTRWLMWGVTLAIVIVAAYAMALNSLPGLQATTQDMVIMRMVGRTVRQLALCVLPIALLYSIARHDLWNVDVIINRTLVYVPLTSVLAVIYATSMSVSQRFFKAATGEESEMATIVATLLLTVVFAPIKDELQKFVDAQFKTAPDPFRRLESFEDQVSEVAEIIDLNRVSAKLLEESIRALSAVGGAVFLIEDGRPRLVQLTERWNGPIVLQVELVYGDLCVGWLVLGARTDGRSYRDEEQARLQETVGEVAHVIALLRLADHPTGGPSIHLERNAAEAVVLPMPRACTA